MNTKSLLLFAAVLALTSVATAQEYGRPDELKGLKKVFIDTGTDLKNRERIVKELEKSRLGLELLDSSDGAEVVMVFNGGKEKELSRVVANPALNSATAVYRKISTGEGVVFVVRDGRARAVMSHADEEKTVWEKKPATNFAKAFLKAYRKANDLK